MQVYKKYLKHQFDKVFSFVIFVLLLPIFIFIVIWQFKNYGFQIFFLQERNGLNGKIFKIVKFRTMLDLRDELGKQLSDRSRLTFSGKILRYFSLDEIPNLINIVKGDMSFIGPRPLPISYYKLMSIDQRKRYTVLPGMTGLSQVSGEDNSSWKERIEFDIKYVEKISFLVDFLIVIKTFKYLSNKFKNDNLGDTSIDNYFPDFNK